jgi:hypothetical protein
MEKQTKILLGVSAIIVAYLFLKNKKVETIRTTPNTNTLDTASPNTNTLESNTSNITCEICDLAIASGVYTTLNGTYIGEGYKPKIGDKIGYNESIYVFNNGKWVISSNCDDYSNGNLYDKAHGPFQTAAGTPDWGQFLIQESNESYEDYLVRKKENEMAIQKSKDEALAKIKAIGIENCYNQYVASRKMRTSGILWQ